MKWGEEGQNRFSINIGNYSVTLEQQLGRTTGPLHALYLVAGAQSTFSGLINFPPF